MHIKECQISDCEDNNEDEGDFSAYESSSENDECSGDEHKEHYFDPTKITTSLPLLPFNNQVGGHASFFRFSKRAICKPVSAREQEFYEDIDAQHHELLPFTSQYMGVLNVTYREEPPVPEVVFEKNKHLLRDWRACASNQYNLRRHAKSCSPGSSHPAQDFMRSSSCRSRSRKFQEQVLREVFSPEALRERLLLAEDWKRRNRLADVASSSGSLNELEFATKDQPHSYSEAKPLWHDDNLIADGGRSVPIMTSRIDFTADKRRTRTRRFEKQFDMDHNVQEDDVSSSSSGSSTLTDSIDNMTLEPKDNQHNEEDDPIFSMDDFQVKTNHKPPVLQVDSSYLNNKQKHGATSDNNPWSLQIYNRDLQRMRNRMQQSTDDNIQKFILIEDLTDGVKYPCVLDLKMGTRQYGVYATREKMRSQTTKCEKSTSKVLGVRVCGMQASSMTKTIRVYNNSCLFY